MRRFMTLGPLVALLFGGCGPTDADRVEDARFVIASKTEKNARPLDAGDDGNWEYLVQQSQKALDHIDRVPPDTFTEPYLVAATLTLNGQFIGDPPMMVVQFVELGFETHGIRLTNEATDEQLTAQRVFDWAGQREVLNSTAIRHALVLVQVEPDVDADEAATRLQDGHVALLFPEEWLADADAIQAELLFNGGRSNAVPLFVRSE